MDTGLCQYNTIRVTFKSKYKNRVGFFTPFDCSFARKICDVVGLGGQIP